MPYTPYQDRPTGYAATPERPFSANSQRPNRSSSYGAMANAPAYPPGSPSFPPASPRDEGSPMLGGGTRSNRTSYFGDNSPYASATDLPLRGNGARSTSPGPNGSFYTLEGDSTRDLRGKEAWGEKGDLSYGSSTIPKLSHGRVHQKRSFWSRFKWWIMALIVAIIAVVVVIVVLKMRNNDNKTSSGSSSADNAGGSDSSDSNSDASTPVPEVATWGALGSTVTMDDGTTFIYNNTFGGHWTSTPYNDTARAQSDIPALNEEWDWLQNSINGVNLGGWLTLEPFISPAMYEPFLNAPQPAIDEYTLSQNLGANLTAAMTEHYETFITEEDFYRIAAAGLNWIRLPIPFWAVETIEGEPFLEGVAWQYFLRGVRWARKYGIRINLDLHAVPGSQNGWNHSGRLGTINFMNGPMGIINAQRTLNYIRTLTEFISQPEYSNVIPMFSFLNEARMADIGAPQMRSFYLAAYQMIRGVTGVGRGPMLAIHDGFADTTLWAGFIPGADRLALDTHPYMAFGGVNNDPISAKIPTPCTGWATTYNTTMNNFGVSMGGEWSLAVNDCGQYVNGVGQGTRYEGNFNGEASEVFGSCTTYQDWTQWTPEMKTQFMDFAYAQMDAMRNFFFWTWKIGTSLSVGRVNNPMWSYELGLREGYMPPNPRAAQGRCVQLLQQYGGGVRPNIAVPSLAPYMTGGGDGVIPPASLAPYQVFPPRGITNAGASLAYTQTGTSRITMAAPTDAPASIAGDGWFNPGDTAPWWVPIATQTYPADPYMSVAPARQKRSEPTRLDPYGQALPTPAPTPRAS